MKNFHQYKQRQQKLFAGINDSGKKLCKQTPAHISLFWKK